MEISGLKGLSSLTIVSVLLSLFAECGKIAQGKVFG